MIMKHFFTLYLGSRHDNPRLDEHDRVTAIHKITRHFDAFTLTDGKGWFGGQFEDVLVIHIATNDIAAIAELALDLRQAINQQGVGVEFAGRYLGARADNTAEELTSSLAGLIDLPTAG